MLNNADICPYSPKPISLEANIQEKGEKKKFN